MLHHAMSFIINVSFKPLNQAIGLLSQSQEDCIGMRACPLNTVNLSSILGTIYGA